MLDIREIAMYNKNICEKHGLDVSVFSITRQEQQQVMSNDIILIDPRNLGCFESSIIKFVDKSKFNIDDYDTIEINDADIGTIQNKIEPFLQYGKKVILKCWTKPSFEFGWKTWGNRIYYLHTIYMGNIKIHIPDWDETKGINIPQAIDPDFFPYKKPRNNPRPFIVGYLGILTWWKGHQLVEKAVSELSDSGHDIQLWMAGRCSPEYKDESPLNHKSIKYFGVLKKRELVPKAFQTFDILCDPWLPKNEPDSFRVAAAEGLMTGLPIVAFDCPASREFIEDGKNGYLVKNNEEMKNAILRYYNNTDLITQHSIYSRQKALEKFAPEVVIDKMARFLHSL